MLKIDRLHAAYGSILALEDVSMFIPKGQIVAVLGANGAGKSSVLRAISGTLRPSQGGIEYGGRRINALSSEDIVRLGIAQVPEGRQLFTAFSVWDNLRLGAYARHDGASVRRDLDAVFSYFPVLATVTVTAVGARGSRQDGEGKNRGPQYGHHF